MLFRHAQSERNLTPELICGQSNEAELSDEGIQQAIDLGVALKSQNILPDKIYSSPALRAWQTGAIAMRQLGVVYQPILDARLLEMSQGEWTGLARDDVYTPDVVAEIDRLDFEFKAPGGESMRELQDRKFEWLQQTDAQLRLHDKDVRRVFVFTHGMAESSLIGRIMGFNREQIRRFSVPNASMAILSSHVNGYKTEYEVTAFPHKVAPFVF